MSASRRSAWQIVLDIVETGLVSALLAGVVALVFGLMLWFLLVRLGSEPLFLIWVFLPPVAASVAALMGAILGALQSRRLLPRPWVAAMVVAVGINVMLAATARTLAGGVGAAVPYVALAVSALAIPLASATTVRAILLRRGSRATRMSRAVMGGMALVVIAIGAVYITKTRAAGYNDVHAVAVTKAGRIYVATTSGLLAADPNTSQWRRLPCGGWWSYAYAVVADRQKPMRLWAEVGEAFWESQDGGESWHRVPEIPRAELMVAIQDRLYVADGVSGFWTYRGGAWEKRPIRDPDGGYFVPTCMAVSPGRSGFALVGNQYSGRLLLTRDGGNTWEKVKLPTRKESYFEINDAAFVPGTPETALVIRLDALLASADDGRTWRATKPPEESLFGARLAVAPTEPATVYLLAGSALYASQDLGGTWRDKSPPARAFLSCLTVDPSDANTIYAGFSEGLYRSRDGGRAWQRIK